MRITGEMLIGARSVRGEAGEMYAVNPSTGLNLKPAFGVGSAAEVDAACLLADAAFDSFRNVHPEQRALLLERIAQNLMDAGETLVERVMAESGLPRARVEGERARTANQLRMFATVVREGRWRQVTINHALPERAPLPRPDLRLQKIPVGPVAVFGASNFPLAFSVSGGDTASALAAGCPVVAKSHPSHLGTSELAGRAIQSAVAELGLHEGVFSLLHGAGNAVGEALVMHPAIQGAAFTGSRGGGLALARLAATRKVPVPVFAEMSSINPLFVLPFALEQRAEKIAQGLADSVTMGTGQFCTKPGLVIGVKGAAWHHFRAAAIAAFEAKPATTMLNLGIHSAFCEGVSQRTSHAKLQLLANGAAVEMSHATGQPALFAVEASEFLKHAELADELFGPSTLLIECSTEDEVVNVARSLEGQLTATMHLEPEDHPFASRLLPILERLSGRILVNGFPTGVEVTNAMVHGGSFPATTDSRFTSVGTMAIERFLRPVCYQDLPASLLPSALQDANPFALERTIDGKREER